MLITKRPDILSSEITPESVYLNRRRFIQSVSALLIAQTNTDEKQTPYKDVTTYNFVEKQPVTAWMRATPNEYGFFANVNPAVDHPRWSQASERRIGEFFKRKTLLFNGYSDQVAHLYSGMDLRKNF